MQAMCCIHQDDEGETLVMRHVMLVKRRGDKYMKDHEDVYETKEDERHESGTRKKQANLFFSYFLYFC